MHFITNTCKPAHSDNGPKRQSLERSAMQKNPANKESMKSCCQLKLYRRIDSASSMSPWTQPAMCQQTRQGVQSNVLENGFLAHCMPVNTKQSLCECLDHDHIRLFMTTVQPPNGCFQHDNAAHRTADVSVSCNTVTCLRGFTVLTNQSSRRSLMCGGAGVHKLLQYCQHVKIIFQTYC